jgi:hypothetical protein
VTTTAGGLASAAPTTPVELAVPLAATLAGVSGAVVPPSSFDEQARTVKQRVATNDRDAETIIASGRKAHE